MKDKLCDKAWKLILDPSKWTKGATARDSSGKKCDPCAPEAVMWCAIGAIKKVYGRVWPELCGITDMNDHWRTRHYDVIKYLLENDL